MKAKRSRNGSMILFSAVIFLAGCVSPQQPASVPEPAPPPSALESQSMDLRQSLMATEFGLIAGWGDGGQIWPDDLLLAAFQQHRSTFEQLHQMIVTDSQLHRVGEDWTDPRDPATIGISPERIAEYRKLLATVGCGAGFAEYPWRPGIHFISAATGMAASGGYVKGYCYLENAPTSVVTNTAAYNPPHAGDDYVVFHPIEGHWYVYFEHR
jgi:hypothetical protein